jgi:DNA-binding SARP family transcriptional activator/class 3 adenylate cyclase/tetratricopeptide (TPR) repeat protein
VEVVVDGRAVELGGEKQRALLALFVLHANEVVSRDFLIDELWGERAPASAAHSIVVYVARLRKALEFDGLDTVSMLGTEAGGYVLRVDPAQIDVQRFERALEQGGRALAAGAVSDAADLLRGACAEWRGKPLSDLAAEPFAEGESWRLEELRLTALGSRIDADLLLGRHAEIVPELESLVRRNPLNERLCAQLMVALYRSGRQARALEVYRTTRRSLVDELGIEPGTNLERLERAILRHDGELEPPAIATAAPVPLPSPAGVPVSPPRRQRKTVSALVARLTPVEQRDQADPESLDLALDRHFAVLKEAIERHGGRVERLGGETTLGIFGVPAVHEDDALRAVRAATDMRDAAGSLTAALTREGAVTLELRVGVDTGPVLTGTTEPSVTGESMVTGLAVSVATELGQVAPAGEILLGPETVRVLAPGVEVGPHAPVAVRGQTEPVRAFRLQRLATDADEISRPGLDLDFVGRVAELKALRGAFEEAVAERSCRLVTVVGEPGIGKTRLLAEFTSTLAGETNVLGGRCLPYGQGITYWPLVGIVRQLGGPDALAERLASDEQAGQVRELILGTIGAAEPIGSVQEAHWAIRRLFEALGRERPLLVVLDDLHWAEPTFLQLVEYLASCSSGAPILLLAAARDELLETRPTWALPRPNALILPLRALSEREAQALIDHAAARSGLSESRRAQVVGAAAGNPLFIEQLLADQTGHGGSAEELVLPPTIEALLAARLDRLPTAERDLLERAAVEGVVFHRGAVTDLLPAAERAEAGAHLLSAIRSNLVRPQPADLPGEEGFRFAHVLVHAAVYASMPKELRAQLHEAFADWLEGHGTTLLELDEVLGYHLEQAARYRRDLGQPDDCLAERAGERLAAAGRRALWRGDEGAAASLLDRAVELTRPIRLDVHLEVDLAYAVGFDHPRRAAGIAGAAAARARAGGDEPGEALARVACAWHRALTGDGDVDELEVLARAAVPLLEAVGDHAGLVRVWEALGFGVAQARGRFEEMVEACEQAIRHAGVGGQRLGDAVEKLAMALADGPRPADEALAALDARRRDARLRDSPRPWLLMYRAYVLAMLERSDEARPSPGQLCELVRESGGAPSEGMAGMIAELQGDHETAARYLRAICDTLEDRGQRAYLSSFAPQLGRSLCALGRFEEAEPLALLGRDLADPRDVLAQMDWRQVQALVDAHRGEWVEAEELAREAVALGERTDSSNCQADALCDLAEVLRAAGRDAEATDVLVQALDRYERKKNLAMARRVHALLGSQVAAAAPGR